MTERWYAIHTIPRSEYLTDVKLRGLGYKTFFPHSVELIAQSKRKSRFVKVAHLTRYTFACFRSERARLESAFQINSLVNRDGDYLCRMVYAGVDANGDRMPFPIPLNVMRPLFDMCDPIDGQLFVRDEDAQSKWGWALGDRVQIGDTKGALRGLFATVEHIYDNGESLRVRLERSMLGQDEATIHASEVATVEKVL